MTPLAALGLYLISAGILVTLIVIALEIWDDRHVIKRNRETERFLKEGK